MTMLNRTKHWMYDLFRYPAYRPADVSYDEYWAHRDTGPLNVFQKARADFLLKHLHDGSSVLDVGCGDGRILSYLKLHQPSLRVSGIDASPKALAVARERGLDVHHGDVRDTISLGRASADYILLLEVLEHMTDSEGLLAWAVAHAKRQVICSVPNTGFIVHRFRLLAGRFPLQWKAHPGEHVRFWTVRDMRWWLNSLGYHFTIHMYEGVPILNRLWPALFAAGMVITISVRER
jgi:methionine biosynthesis protein MetW